MSVCVCVFVCVLFVDSACITRAFIARSQSNCVCYLCVRLLATDSSLLSLGALCRSDLCETSRTIRVTAILFSVLTSQANKHASQPGPCFVTATLFVSHKSCSD